MERRTRPFSTGSAAAQNVVWLNGRLLLAGRAQIDPSDRGLLLGDGLFETMRAVGGIVPLLDRHLARLATAAEVLGLPIPVDESLLADACASLLRANRLSDAGLRLTLTRGPGARGLLPPADPAPTLLIAAFPAPPALPPARMIVAEVTRRNQRSPLARLKTLSYLDNMLALREARGAAADDAFMLNTTGEVACATTANVFAIEGGTLVTPPVSDGALPGITRSMVMELAAEIGVACREETLSPERLNGAPGVFLTSSLAGLRPVVGLDGTTVGSGEPHPLAVRLQHLWQAWMAGD